MVAETWDIMAVYQQVETDKLEGLQ